MSPIKKNDEGSCGHQLKRDPVSKVFLIVDQVNESRQEERRHKKGVPNTTKS